MTVAKNKVVLIDYTLTNNSGEVLDSSEGGEPLAYIHGIGNIIAGLEEALEGRKTGDSLSVSISPEKGYGVRDDAKIQTVPRRMFQGVDDINPGMQFHAQTQNGLEVVTVTGVTSDMVTVDANHPLAGETLNFAVTIIEVRDPSEEEMEHGHVHGPGGHHH